MGQNADRYNVRVLDRAIGLLHVLSDGKPRILMEISEALELNSSTTYRLLASLISHRFVERDDQTGRYTLGLACLELAQSYQAHNVIRRAALPELERLREEMGETIHLAVLDRMEVVYLEKLQGYHAVSLMISTVGGRVPAYCTGLGKVLLAYADVARVRAHYAKFDFIRFTNTTISNVNALLDELETIRRRGYAFDKGEHEAEVRCIAAPIYNGSGEVVAALSMAGPASRMEPLESNQVSIDRILKAAYQISAKVVYRRPPIASSVVQGTENEKDH